MRDWSYLKNTDDDVVIDNFDFAVRLSASLVAQIDPDEIRYRLRRLYRARSDSRQYQQDTRE